MYIKILTIAITMIIIIVAHVQYLKYLIVSRTIDHDNNYFEIAQLNFVFTISGDKS